MPIDTIGSEAGKLANASGEWNALYTKHQHEKRVAQTLLNREMEVFLPTYRKLHRWKDRTKQVELPLFPCYVFIRADMRRQMEILSTGGVFSIVGCAGRPAIIARSEIDSLRQVSESPIGSEPHPFLKSGDRVRVLCGPLKGVEGVLDRSKSSARLVISVEMLGMSAAVEIDSANVEVVSRCIPIGPSVHRFSSAPVAARVPATSRHL